MSRSFRQWSWRILLGLLSWSTSGWAQSINLVALDWTTLEGCPRSDVVEQRVRDWAGSITRREPLRAKGEVRADATGVQLHLETQDAGQTFVRDVHLPTCEQAAETAALVLAMALRAELVAPSPLSPVAPNPLASVDANLAVPVLPVPAAPAPPISAASTPPLPVAPPPLPAVPAASVQSEPLPPQALPAVPANPAANAERSQAPEPPKADSGREPAKPMPRRPFSVGAGGVAAWGLLPKALWGASATGALTFDPWRVEVVGAFAPSQRVTLANDASRGGEFVLWSAGLRGCYVAALAQIAALPVQALACVGGEGGQLRGIGFGTGWKEEGVSPWWALNAGLGALLSATERLRAVLRLELLAPLWHDRFVLQSGGDSEGEVARPGAVVGRVGVGLEVVF